MKLFEKVLAVFAAALFASTARAGESVLRVVTTLPDYAAVARAVGGDRVEVQAIVQGDQDAHFIRPKPSFVNMVKKADVLIATGLDLELWLPTVVDKSGNRHVRSGMPGYVAASRGMTLLEKPQVLSRIEGGVHIYGNPHVTTSPVNMRVAAKNIAAGLETNDPEGADYYSSRLQDFIDELDRRLFGEELVGILGGDTLAAIAEKGELHSFLEGKTLGGKPLRDMLGGWMKEMAPLYGLPVVTYHKNWVYFTTLFGLEEVGNIEPKPGISPSPKHVTELVETMRRRKVSIVLAANYFDEQKTRAVASKVGAAAVIVPLYVDAAEGIEDYFDLVDLWVDRLTEAASRTALSPGRP